MPLLLLTVIKQGVVLNEDPTGPAPVSVRLAVPLPLCAQSDVRTTWPFIVPAVIVWLLVVVAVKTAAAPAPIRARAATPVAPKIAIFRVFILSFVCDASNSRPIPMKIPVATATAAFLRG